MHDDHDRRATTDPASPLGGLVRHFGIEGQECMVNPPGGHPQHGARPQQTGQRAARPACAAPTATPGSICPAAESAPRRRWCRRWGCPHWGSVEVAAPVPVAPVGPLRAGSAVPGAADRVDLGRQQGVVLADSPSAQMCRAVDRPCVVFLVRGLGRLGQYCAGDPVLGGSAVGGGRARTIIRLRRRLPRPVTGSRRAVAGPHGLPAHRSLLVAPTSGPPRNSLGARAADDRRMAAGWRDPMVAANPLQHHRRNIMRLALRPRRHHA